MFKIILYLLIFTSFNSFAVSLVKVIENDMMTIFVDIDSIRRSENNLTFSELLDLKVAHKSSKNLEFQSYAIEVTINCATTYQKVHHIIMYTSNMGKGKEIVRGRFPNPPRILLKDAINFKTMEYVCSHYK
jgi:hypothetical protein